MPTKAYFIGLGGCGLKTVSNLQQRLCPTGDFSEYQFTYVDTDDSTIEKINNEKVVIRPADMINVGDTNPYQVYASAEGGNRPRDIRFKQWMIPQGKGAGFVLPNNFLADGARGQRMIGRTGFYYRYDDILAEFRRKLATFAEYDPRADHNQIPQIWVVASSCGGTGSSMTLDVLYLLDKLVNEGWHSAPELRLVLFMPKPFIEANYGNPDYPLNAFSYFWELNAFRLDHQLGNHDRFHHFCVDPSGDAGRSFPLYKYIIPVDMETSFGSKIPLDTLYPTVAELLYYCNNGAAAQQMMSDLSNDQNTLNGLTEHNSTPFKWTQTLAPYGYRLIKKANEEFKEYMNARAKYEVLTHGLLGSNMPDDPAIRDKAKKSFGNEYIVRYLCDLSNVSALEDNSLQADIAESYSEIAIVQTGIDKNRIQYCLNQMDEMEIDAKSLHYRRAVDRLKKAIDTGVQKSVIEHGLRYSKEVLNLVDDFYLETSVMSELKNELNDIQASKAEKRSQCEQLRDSFKDKHAAATCKALNEYKELSQRYTTLSIAIAILDNEMTSYPNGYLEILRKGNEKFNGLQSVITKVEIAAVEAGNAYTSLAQKFIDSGKDALTEYLPRLEDIAKGENDSYWADNSLFDLMYRDTIVDTVAVGSVKVPVRKNDGDNNLCAFVEKVCTGDTSVLKLVKDDDKLRFEKNFTNWIIEPLMAAISNAVQKEGTQASKWLKYTLAESLDMEKMLPNGETREKFINAMANHDRIPVLFPTAAAATKPSLVRLMYAGASESLAKELGYIPSDAAGNKFVQDPSMTDRFLIIKIPMGYDFFSYKYFLEIQKAYSDRRREIIHGAHGCHIHKDFAQLDIEKAATFAQVRTNMGYIRDLYFSVFLQEFLTLLKKENKEQYDRLFGIFTMPTLGGAASPFGAPTATDPFSSASPFGAPTAADQFGGAAAADPFGVSADPFGSASPFGAAATDPFGGVASPFGDVSADIFADTTAPQFFVKADYNEPLQTLTISVNKLVKTDHHVDYSGEEASVEVKRFTSFSHFLKDLIDNDSAGLVKSYLCSVEVLKEHIMSDRALLAAYTALFAKTREAALKNVLFVLAAKWNKMGIKDESQYFTLLSQILSGRA